VTVITSLKALRHSTGLSVFAAALFRASDMSGIARPFLLFRAVVTYTNKVLTPIPRRLTTLTTALTGPDATPVYLIKVAADSSLGKAVSSRRMATLFQRLRRHEQFDSNTAQTLRQSLIDLWNFLVYYRFN
jgi:hypothetical protein